jgi:hypothetical protein
MKGIITHESWNWGGLNFLKYDIPLNVGRS